MDVGLNADIARYVVVFGVSIALAGCGLFVKQPVPTGEPAPRAERPPRAEPPVERPLPSERPPVDSSKTQTVVALARRYVGAPYRWGGSSPAGFDCSGLVRYVYAQVGISLPHNAAQQYRLGAPVPRESLEPGDLVFFDRLRHNGIYVGAGLFVHARQPGRGVNIARLDDGWYASHWVGARRLALSADAGWDQER
jgi:cell wall-associated NlpC family hydrolase